MANRQSPIDPQSIQLAVQQRCPHILPHLATAWSPDRLPKNHKKDPEIDIMVRVTFNSPEFQINASDAGMRFNLHHIEPIESGGAVYDLSNLQIVSSKVHFEIHNP
jgi:hypothetical protein